MADTEKSSTDNAQDKRPSNEQEETRTENIMNQLKEGKLKGKVIVILVMGSAGAGKSSLIKLMTNQNITIQHGLGIGTLTTNCTVAEIDSQKYLFIDTPGFGQEAKSPDSVKNDIFVILGYFTRILGGIHGIIYIQNILADRMSNAETLSLKFLGELAGENFISQITFITTKWDIVFSTDRRRRESNEQSLKLKFWKGFRLEMSNGARYARHGVSCDDSGEEEKANARGLLKSNVLAFYKNRNLRELTMPFSQLTFGQQAKVAALTTLRCFVAVAAPAAVLGAGVLYMAAVESITLTFTILI